MLNNKILLIQKIIILINCLLIINSNAQNLVPNPSFELFKLCPTVYNTFNINQDWNDLQKFCADWESVGTIQHYWTGAGGQYLNACANIDKNYCGIPQSVFAFQNAHSGNGMLQLAQTYPGFTQERIFQGVKLISPLKIGHKYLVSFYTSLADSSHSAMNNLGITFYTQKQKIIDTSNISSLFYPDWAHVYSKDVIDNKTDWVKIEGVITADSAYQYLVVGNFFDYNKTTFKSFNNIVQGTVQPIYLLDDFTVEETKKTIAQTNTTICKSDTLKLNAIGSSQTFYWSLNMKDTFSTNEELFLKVDSSFKIYLISNWGIDSIQINSIEYPKKIIPIDTLLCSNYYLKIDGYNNIGKYKWNTGETNSKITIDKAGVYVLETTTGSCYRIDTLTVTSCQPTLYIPNAFSPNNDNVNDLFLPKGVQVFNYNLTIYNRWGQLVFETKDINQGWDGNGFGLDIYFYNVTYSDKENTTTYQKSGNLTLIR